MRKQGPILIAAAGMFALAACSSGLQNSNSSLPTTGASQSAMRSSATRTGILPSLIAKLDLVRSLAHRNRAPARPAKAAKYLYVDDVALNEVLLFSSKTYANSGNTITDGIDCPDGNWADKSGNVYVANCNGASITEYSSAGSLIYTYTTGIDDPVEVTTDKNGNVYEADYNVDVSGGGFVNEYAQQSNTVSETCATGGNVEGVAVDKHGDVFVYQNLSGGGADIVEYVHGLSGCNGTTLSPTFDFAGGLVLDSQANLIAVDQAAEAVDVIAPPYTSITSTLGSGWVVPFHATINKKNTLAYVADYGDGDVQVIDYPSGTSVATIGSSGGLEFPVSAVNYANYVP